MRKCHKFCVMGEKYYVTTTHKPSNLLEWIKCTREAGERDMTPGVNFINILRSHFSHKILAPKITKLCFGFEVLDPKILYKNVLV